MQGALVLALSNDQAYTHFMDAVDLVIYDAIVERLSSIEAGRMAGRFRWLEGQQRHNLPDTGSGD
jgi:hypothetical protein